MGRMPSGFKVPGAIDQFGNVHALDGGGVRKPNGNDFWWGELFDVGAPTMNCWYDNTGRRRHRGERDRARRGRAHRGRPAAGAPVGLRDERGQHRCAPSSGTWSNAGTVPTRTPGPTDCDWWELPAQPGSAAAAAAQASRDEAAEAFEDSPEARALERRVAALTP